MPTVSLCVVSLMAIFACCTNHSTKNITPWPKEQPTITFKTPQTNRTDPNENFRLLHQSTIILDEDGFAYETDDLNVISSEKKRIALDFYGNLVNLN